MQKSPGVVIEAKGQKYSQALASAIAF